MVNYLPVLYKFKKHAFCRWTFLQKTAMQQGLVQTSAEHKEDYKFIGSNLCHIYKCQLNRKIKCAKAAYQKMGDIERKRRLEGKKEDSLDTNILHKHKPHVGAASSSQLG